MNPSITRRITIDIETCEVTIIREKRDDEQHLCERCAGEIGDEPVKQAAVSIRQIEIEAAAPVS